MKTRPECDKAIKPTAGCAIKGRCPSNTTTPRLDDAPGSYLWYTSSENGGGKYLV